MNPGFIYALCAFSIWGLFPLYFRLIPLVAPLELVMQRTLWSLLFLGLLLTGLKRWAWLKQVWSEPRKLPLYAFSAVLLAANWMVYVYAIQTQQVAEASLGYFINPLVSVLLGVLVLRERLGVVKWVAVGLAATGVFWLTWKLGRLPWIALVLACSFGIYGLVRKTSPLGALEGLALETLLLSPIALPALLWWTVSHNGAWAQPDLTSAAWLVLSGPLSVFPLLFFAAAARRLPLATVGLVQYLSPSIQLLLAIWVFHEPFNSDRLVGFAFIWSALALVSADAIRQSLRPPPAAVEAADPAPLR